MRYTRNCYGVGLLWQATSTQVYYQTRGYIYGSLAGTGINDYLMMFSGEQVNVAQLVCHPPVHRSEPKYLINKVHQINKPMYDLVSKSQTNHLTKIKACHLGIPTHSATAPQKPGRIHMRICSNQVNDLASTSVEDRRITHAAAGWWQQHIHRSGAKKPCPTRDGKILSR